MQKSTARSSKEPSDQRAKRVRRSLVGASSAPKAGIARVLLLLHQEGYLSEGLIDTENEHSVRKAIGKAAGEISAFQTPWGPLVQEMELPTDPPTKWPFIHPLALVYYLSSISSAFAKIMSDCFDACKSLGRLLNIVIFVDEHRPGNVLRPDSGRATQGRQ